jgi:hypothetical protein
LIASEYRDLLYGASLFFFLLHYLGVGLPKLLAETVSPFRQIKGVFSHPMYELLRGQRKAYAPSPLHQLQLRTYLEIQQKRLPRRRIAGLREPILSLSKGSAKWRGSPARYFGDRLSTSIKEVFLCVLFPPK